MLMLMHVGCRTMKCGSMMCRNYDGTCDGGWILVGMEKEQKQELVICITHSCIPPL